MALILHPLHARPLDSPHRLQPRHVRRDIADEIIFACVMPYLDERSVCALGGTSKQWNGKHRNG